MKSRTMLAALVCALLAWTAPAAAQEAAGDKARTAAANELIQAMLLEKTFGGAIEKTVDMQTRQNPMLAPYRGVMLAFFSKYMSWESLKEDIAGIYVSEFTTQELGQMTAFYKTPVGAKAALRMPELMSKGMELGMKRVQEHLPELQQMIAEESEKLKKQAAPDKPAPLQGK